MHELTFISLPLAASLIGLGIIYLAWRRRGVTGAIPFIVVLLGIVEWSLCQFATLLSDSTQAKLFWDNLQFTGQDIAGAASIVFVLHYTGRKRSWLARHSWLMAVMPVLNAILVWTNHWHHLARRSYHLHRDGSLEVVVDKLGIWGQFNAFYTLVLSFIALLLLLARLLWNASRQYQIQTSLIMAGMMLPYSVGIVVALGAIDIANRAWMMPLAFIIDSGLLAWALFQYDLFRLAPLARDTIIENMADGMLALDIHNVIVDINPAAQQILGYAPARVIGRMLGEAMPELLPYMPTCEINVDLHLGERYYNVLCTPLYDKQKTLGGRLVLLRDITDHKQIEQVLRETEERYHHLIETMNEGFSIRDEHGISTYVNDRFCEMLGYTREEIIGQPLDAFIDPSSRTKIRQSTSESYEMVWRTKDGRRVPTILSPRPIFDPEGVFQGSFAVITDITMRKEIEDQLRQRNRELDLFNRVMIAVTSSVEITDLLTTVCYELAHIFNVPQAATALLSPDRRVYRVEAEYLAEGQTTSAMGIEYPIKNNPVLEYFLEHRTALMVSDVIHDPVLVYNEHSFRNILARGTVSMLIVPLWVQNTLIGTIGLDSTEPRTFTPDEIGLATSVAVALSHALQNSWLYAQLRHSETRYRTLFEQARDAIFIEDRAGRIVDANPAASALFGYTYDELYNMTLHDLQVMNPRPSGTRFELTGQTHDGVQVPVEVTRAPLTEDPDTLYLLVMRDMTEHKHAEKERENLITELRSFAHTVAHDLKNPLASIIAYSITFEEDFEPNLTPPMREMLGIIQADSLRMNDIIDGLLILATVRDQQEIDRVPLNMSSIVKQTVQRLNYLIALQHATVDITADDWPVALGYAPWVGEVWANYLSNALKYGGDPPHITLGTDRLPGGMARFWVHDSGPGISQHDQARLFTQFTRLTRAHTQGYGLGLSISKRIAERLGGQVGVESAPGQGSTFWFTLPLAPQEEESPCIPT